MTEQSSTVRGQVLGAVLAGGRSSRFGSDKGLAEIAGVRLARRVVQALEPVTGRVVIVANEPAEYAAEGWEVRPDVVPGIGALGGIHAAVSWAADLGVTGCLVLACDMPLVPPSLLAELAAGLGSAAVAVPASRGPRGLEPLCAAYSVECLPAIERAIRRGDRAVISFFGEVDVRVLDLTVVSRFGQPERIFFNVNRPEDRRIAESLLASDAREPAVGRKRPGGD